jgi:DNA-binding HxlR family transcriptional regulator
MEKECTIYKTADFIGKKWTLLILLEIYKGNNKIRYSKIKKNLPSITPKILSSRLKELTKEGLINKQIFAETSPIRSEYSLTDAGSAFIQIIQDMKAWALEWKFKNKECSKKDCNECLMDCL